MSTAFTYEYADHGIGSDLLDMTPPPMATRSLWQTHPIRTAMRRAVDSLYHQQVWDDGGPPNTFACDRSNRMSD